MGNVAEVFNQDRRLVILRLLHEDTDYRLNERLLQKALKLYGHNRSDVEIREDLEWLQRERAVDIEKLGDIWIATLTRTGAQHVEGDLVIDGIARPRPDH